MNRAMELKPLSVSFTLKDHIHEILRDAILDLNIYDDTTNLKLDERSMAEQLGISRTPVREALARLERDGFVEIQPRKGVFVRRKSLEEVLEMVVVWAALESMAARLATQRASDAEIRTLHQFVVQDHNSKNKAEIAEYSEANIKFHQRIFELSKCSRLKETADELFLHMHAVRRRTLLQNDPFERCVVDHMQIIKALETRNGDRASTLVREHTMRLHDHIDRTWTRLEELSKIKKEAP